jgi:hypothetical protein
LAIQPVSSRSYLEADAFHRLAELANEHETAIRKPGDDRHSHAVLHDFPYRLLPVLQFDLQHIDVNDASLIDPLARKCFFVHLADSGLNLRMV